MQHVWRSRASLLIACALPLAVLANIMRITTVIIVGDIWTQKAGVMIEQKFGFVTFAIAMLGLMAIGWLIREKEPKPVKKEEPVLEGAAV